MHISVRSKQVLLSAFHISLWAFLHLLGHWEILLERNSSGRVTAFLQACLLSSQKLPLQHHLLKARGAFPS